MNKKSEFRLHIFDAVGIPVKRSQHLLADNPDSPLVPLVEKTDILQKPQIDALARRNLLLLQKLQLPKESKLVTW